MSRRIRTKRRDEKTPRTLSRSQIRASSLPRKTGEGVAAQFQKQYGNTAVQRMAASGLLETKLKIGRPGDRFEREADNVADRVMKMPEPDIGRQADEEEEIQTLPLADQITPVAQRQAEEEEQAQSEALQQQKEDEEPVQPQVLQKQEGEEEPARLKHLQPQEEEESLQPQSPQQQEEEEEPVQAKTLQRQVEEEQEPLQAKGSGPKTGRIAPSIESGIASMRGSGRPLPAATRSFFEPRFGADFSGVSVHADSSANHFARRISARAFTLGRNIFFAAGEYSPDSPAGKRLLAHELTHVIQQKKRLAIQYKIKTNNVSLDKYFPSGLPGIKKSNSTYSINSGASYTSIKKQIVSDLLLSPRVFKVKGNNLIAAYFNFNSHINARKGIIDFASQKQYTFGAGSAFRMNPEYWVKVNNNWRVKPGKSRKEAYADVNKNPTKYNIACHAATVITMLAGSGFANLKKDSGVGDSDWVPGDWGYIKNTNFPGHPVGQEGENLINVSPGRFWGHITKTNTYKSISAWMNKVKGWHGAAKLLKWRKRPKTGLEN